MKFVSVILGLVFGATSVVAGCQPMVGTAKTQKPIQYLGVQTQLLAQDLVRLNVTLVGAEDGGPVAQYAECAAAQYTLIRGFGFARHIRTQIGREGRTWNADAVYTVSDILPRGSRTLDAEVIADNCRLNEIPMV